MDQELFETRPAPDALTPEEMAELLEFNRALNRRRDRDSFLSTVAQLSYRLWAVDRVVASFVESAPRSDAQRSSVYSAEEPVRHYAREARSGRSALDWVIQHRRAITASSPDAIRMRFPATAALLEAEAMSSILIVPLLAQDRCLGALGFMARKADRWKSDRHVFVDEVAATLAAALDNALEREQLERVGRELGAVLDVNRATGRHLRRDTLFGALANCLQHVVPTERFGIEMPLEGGKLQAHVLGPIRTTTETTRPEVLDAEGTACRWVEENRTRFLAPSRNSLRERFPVTFRVMEREGMESLCALPLVTGQRCRGVLFFMAAERGAYDRLSRTLLDQVADAVGVALDDCLAHEEVRRLRDQLAAENVYLQEEIKQTQNFGEIVGNSEGLRRMLDLVESVAPTNVTVLISGETGTGKELIARAIHDLSPRRDRALVKVNCAAISAGLVESELFGHAKGAFTGAMSTRVGRFELANGGTLFLDEVGELPIGTQLKLLRVLQEREFEPVGSNRTCRVDVRVLAATNRDLEREVAEGRFRADLYYRLNVVPIRVPPLRDRREDLPLLVSFLLERSARELGKAVEGVSKDTMGLFLAYDWPGNIREVHNVIQRAVVLAKGPILEIAPDLLALEPERPAVPPMTPRGPTPVVAGTESLSFFDVSRRHIAQALENARWVIEGPQGAAAILGLSPSTLRSRMKKLGLRRPPSYKSDRRQDSHA